MSEISSAAAAAKEVAAAFLFANMYTYLPFYFERSNGLYLVSNIFRDFIYLTEDEFRAFESRSISKDSELYSRLVDKNFIYSKDKSDEYTSIYLKTHENLFESTFLHIFVLTLDCNLVCRYCQAEAKDFANCNTNMTVETADKAVDISLSCPTESLRIEFQGGEPLLNFPVLQYIVNEFNRRKGDRKISFSIVTNTHAMTEEICDWLIENKVNLCFSFDGSRTIHDFNRPAKDSRSNYDSVCRWKQYCTEKGVHVGLLPTVTRCTIEHPRDFYDALNSNGVKSFSLRELAPLGRCLKNWSEIGYTADEFFNFYKTIIGFMLESYKKGERVMEIYTHMYLRLLYTKEPNYFTDLKSPCGAGIGQMAYNWNGKIYSCDEGRMISNSGDETFCIGDVNCTYKECMASENLTDICCASCIDAHPVCKDCVFNPICGICPAYNYSQTHTLLGISAQSDRCRIFKRIIFYILDNVENDTETGKMFRDWAGSDILP